MDETVEEPTSSTVTSFKDCQMSSTSDEMCDIALKCIMNLRSHRTEEKQIDGLEALCQITSDVLSNGNADQESNYLKSLR